MASFVNIARCFTVIEGPMITLPRTCRYGEPIPVSSAGQKCQGASPLGLRHPALQIQFAEPSQR